MSTLGSEPRQLFTPVEMMREAEQFALSKSKKSTGMILSLAIMAGVFIGLAFLFYITVTTESDSGWGTNRFIGGLAFSMGLILIVICGGELFTSSVLSAISWANKQIKMSTMFAIWGKVYIGNFLGATLLLLLVTGAQLYQLDHGQWGLNALNIAQHKLHHTPVQAFSLGVLCNLLVCLAIWLTFSSNNAMTKAFMVILPVSMFVSSGFEHCVANMFMVPLGIVIQNFAPESFWTAVNATPAQYADLNVATFITANLIPVTLGNIVGGAVLVGLSNWNIYSKPLLKAAVTPITTAQSLTSVKDIDMNTQIFAKDIMNTQPAVLNADMPIPLAMDILEQKAMSSAPVCDVNGRLVGFLSAHDVMVELWCQDYLPNKEMKVVDLMSRDIVAIDANESLVNIVEFLAIDKEQVFPTTSMGYATSFTTLSLEERAKAAKVKKPQVLPVLEHGQFVGVVSRVEVMHALRPIYGDKINVVNQETKVLETA
ncbi:formate transporter FocA [Vibrio maerlii]|uniref:formate transporter FocA n=1 Tax=Vibrio maerlii TaxID=2231648 RepID=UPI000E3D85FB|nr:formate transporter FocA [Vibrio maerlii]